VVRGPGSSDRGERLVRGTGSTPIGDVLLLASDRGLCALEFLRPARTQRLNARLARWFPAHQIVDGHARWIEAAERWLRAYFEGRNRGLGALKLDLRGTPFERSVWQALIGIPSGETRTYGDLATQIGSPRAARAVGAANGANPISIIVPCHRAVASDGSLVKYGGGLHRKAWLLEHEAGRVTALTS
jgi:O-6-methylguanine DNA methyltransferase